MSNVLSELVALLRLEPLEENLFRGQSQDLGWGIVYGGQVLGQALSAATQTTAPDRFVHSLQAYFLRPGDVKKPVVYQVDRIRDGGSFTTRRVTAIQSGEAILNLAASFQKEEPGFDHQDPMPKVSGPEGLLNHREIAASYADKLPEKLRLAALGEKPFEFRPTDPDRDPASPVKGKPERFVWMKTIAPLPEERGLHSALLAYASDYSFITTALKPHGVTWLSPGMHVASVDHVMWFHTAPRVDRWLLHAMESPRAVGARGLVRGKVFSEDGVLVASTAQEGLIRSKSFARPGA